MPADRPLRQIRFRRPPGAADLLLVRHGESEAATPERPFPLVDGHGDPALHEAGRAQADALADRLGDQPVTAIYVSQLRRTAETAAPLASRLGLTPVVDPDLVEVHLGEWEGGRYRERVAAGDPIVARIGAESRWDVIPGAEPAEELAARVGGALDRIAAAHPDGLVVVVCHGGVIGEAIGQACGAGPIAFAMSDNGSISHVVWGAGVRSVRRFNDTGHLGRAFGGGGGVAT